MPEENKNGFTPLENYSKSTRNSHSNKSNVSNIVHRRQGGSLTGFKVFYAVSFAFQLGFLVVVPIGGFMFLGLLGDKYFHTKPLLFIAGIIIGIIIAVYEVYRFLIPLIEKK